MAIDWTQIRTQQYVKGLNVVEPGDWIGRVAGKEKYLIIKRPNVAKWDIAETDGAAWSTGEWRAASSAEDAKAACNAVN